MVDLDEMIKPKKKWGTKLLVTLLIVLIIIIVALIIVVIILLAKKCDKCANCYESSPPCGSDTVEPLYFTLLSTKVNYADTVNGNYTNAIQILSNQIHDALTDSAVRSGSEAFTNFDGSNSNILPVAILGISPSPTGYGVAVIGSTIVIGQNLLSPRDAINRLTSHNLTAYVINNTVSGVTLQTEMCQKVNSYLPPPTPTQSSIMTTSMQPAATTSTVMSPTSTPGANCPTCTSSPPPTPYLTTTATTATATKTTLPSSSISSTATQPFSSSSSLTPSTSPLLSTLTTLPSFSSSVTPSITTSSSQGSVSSSSSSMSTSSATLPNLSSSTQSTSTSSVTSTSTTPTTTCSPPPTQSPPYPCQANIVLLLDASNGMSAANFSLQQQFIGNELLDAGWTFTQLVIGAYDDTNIGNFQAPSVPFGAITSLGDARAVINSLNHKLDPASIATGLQTIINLLNGQQQPCVKQVTVVFASTSDLDDVAAAKPFAKQLQALGPVIFVAMGPNANSVILSSLATPGPFISWTDYNDTAGLATKILLAFNCNSKVQNEEELVDV